MFGHRRYMGNAPCIQNPSKTTIFLSREEKRRQK
uniref:Uncharacterized protein n=1 Tax=viral metagenome TaxID=1070528 RepID=A0A6C0AIA5_9ZZZZ